MDFAEELKYLMKNSRHITDKEIREKTKQYKLSIKRGMKFEVTGDSKEYWIEDYNCRVNTIATLEEDVTSNKQRKILVTLEEIDNDRNVCVSINLNKLIGTSYDTPVNKMPVL